MNHINWFMLYLFLERFRNRSRSQIVFTSDKRTMRARTRNWMSLILHTWRFHQRRRLLSTYWSSLGKQRLYRASFTNLSSLTIYVRTQIILVSDKFKVELLPEHGEEALEVFRKLQDCYEKIIFYSTTLKLIFN